MEVFNQNNSGGYITQEQEQQQQYPYGQPLPDPFNGSKPVSQDQSFMKELFAFRKEVIEPLRWVWRGYEFDHQKGEWTLNPESKPIMNDKGIGWSISLIESYINPVFIVSNYNSKHFNFDMREACKVIWNSLSLRYKEFGMTKTDIPRVAGEIETKIKAILMGAIDNGFRDFFTRQSLYHVQESINSQPQHKDGVVSSIFGMFKPKQEINYK